MGLGGSTQIERKEGEANSMNIIDFTLELPDLKSKLVLSHGTARDTP
jgi:hypothetical protein